jgi:hypothetical protein
MSTQIDMSIFPGAVPYAAAYIYGTGATGGTANMVPPEGNGFFILTGVDCSWMNVVGLVEMYALWAPGSDPLVPFFQAGGLFDSDDTATVSWRGALPITAGSEPQFSGAISINMEGENLQWGMIAWGLWIPAPYPIT